MNDMMDQELSELRQQLYEKQLLKQREQRKQRRQCHLDQNKQQHKLQLEQHWQQMEQRLVQQQHNEKMEQHVQQMDQHKRQQRQQLQQPADTTLQSQENSGERSVHITQKTQGKGIQKPLFDRK